MQTAPGQPVREPCEMVMRPPTSPVARVIVGVDGSAGAAAAVQWAAAEACRRQVMLRIVSAWEELDQPGPSLHGDPVKIAAAQVQKALRRVLGRLHYPCRIACCMPEGMPGQALLDEVGQAGLLVLGLSRTGATPVPGRVNWYCLRRGHDPLVFVPAMPSG